MQQKEKMAEQDKEIIKAWQAVLEEAQRDAD